MSHVIAAAALAIFVAAAISDMATRRISNGLVVALAVVGLVRLAMDVGSGAGLVSGGMDLALAAIVLGFGAAAFGLRLMGGGDVKLMAAAALVFGTSGTGPFLIATVLSGGVLACSFLLRRGVRRLAGGPVEAAKDSLPYGVAIAAGGAFVTIQAF